MTPKMRPSTCPSSARRANSKARLAKSKALGLLPQGEQIKQNGPLGWFGLIFWGMKKMLPIFFLLGIIYTKPHFYKDPGLNNQDSMESKRFFFLFPQVDFCW